MIVVNLWFIKHSNGLFHYGLDYAAALAGNVREIWVRDAGLAALVAERLPEIPVHVFNAKSFLRAAIATVRRRDMLFTASSHPIAFVPRQIVVVHDSFPFVGKAGSIKCLLFRIGLFWSGGTAGYINHADAHRFLKSCNIPATRTRYLPNRIGRWDVLPSGLAIIGDPIVVGLFGSDSPKKNYDALFAEIVKSGGGAGVEWQIFGHENKYTGRLKRDYPSCSITVIPSDAISMVRFIMSIDIAMSVATGEGFARPVAMSLMRGVPTLLLDTPVFREFYTGSAQIFSTIQTLVEAVVALRVGDRLDRPVLMQADGMRADFDAGIKWLERHS